MGKQTDIREGDIADIRRRMREEGRPLRSTIIRDKEDRQIIYKEEGGRVTITEVIDE